MKRVISLICMFLGSQSASCIAMADELEPHTRYIYCNVYAASACFGVARGDVLTMRMPVDFTTYELELVDGTKVLIYSGYNPTQVSAVNGSASKSYAVPAGTYEYLLTADDIHVITYTPNDVELPLLQVVVDQDGESEPGLIVGFLNSFRPCEGDGYGVACSKETILFKEIAQEVFDKGKSTSALGSSPRYRAANHLAQRR